MRPLNLRQLRNTSLLKNRLRPGNTVELKERDRVIARIVPENQPAAPVKYPDFAARSIKIFSGRVVSIVDDLIKDRGCYRPSTQRATSWFRCACTMDIPHPRKS
jgi:antitoxin (DNA-binding transcriptional repressor) of toxin-antitoxin stability system